MLFRANPKQWKYFDQDFSLCRSSFDVRRDSGWKWNWPSHPYVLFASKEPSQIQFFNTKTKTKENHWKNLFQRSKCVALRSSTSTSLLSGWCASSPWHTSWSCSTSQLLPLLLSVLLSSLYLYIIIGHAELLNQLPHLLLSLSALQKGTHQGGFASATSDVHSHDFASRVVPEYLNFQLGCIVVMT